jgi:CHAT domain-containing protein
MMRRTILYFALVLGNLHGSALISRADQPVAPPLGLSKADEDWVANKFRIALEMSRKGQWGIEEAQKPIREILDLCTRKLGKDHYRTAAYRREIDVLEKLVQLSQADRAEYLKTYSLYDSVNALRIAGRYADAQVPAKQLLTIYRSLLGPDAFYVAFAANWYGQVLYHSELYDEAEKQLREAVRVYEAVVGDNHPDVGEAAGYLALDLERLGRYAEAQKRYEVALRITLKHRGENDARTSVAHNNLAGFLDRQARLPEAEDHYRKALKALQAMGPEADQLLATAYNNLALNLQHQSKFAEAEELFQEALTIRRRLKKENHPDTGRVYLNLASNREAQGKVAAAEPIYRRALEIYLKGYGSNSAETAWAMNSLAVNLDKQGNYAEAEARLREGLEILRKAPGDQRRAIAKFSINLASALGGQDKHAAAQALSEEALTILRKLLEADHPDIAAALNNLASALVNQERYADAEPHFREALSIMERRPGKDHPDTAMSRVNLAINLYYQGKFAEAEPLLESALETMQKVLGEGHPNTAWAYKNLVGNACARAGYASAMKRYDKATASFEAARLQLGFAGRDRARRTSDISPMSALAVAAARTGRPLEAWQALERNLSRGLLDDWTASRLSDAERMRVQKLLEKTAIVDTDAKSPRVRTEQERAAAQAELARMLADPTAKFGVAGGQVYELSRIQKQLPEDAALVAWVDLGKAPAPANPRGDHWACVVRRQGAPDWIQLPGTGADGAWTDEDDWCIVRARRAFARRPSDASGKWKELASKLAKQRLTPLEPYLKARDGLPDVHRLIVLPFPRMAAVPMEVLTDRFVVSYAPSATAFAWLKEQRAQAGVPGARLLALGDPAFAPPREGGSATQDKAQADGARKEEFVRLPGTRQELMGLARVFSETRLLMGDQASEGNLDELARSGGLSRYRYLHFATHGVFDNQDPLQSALILTRAPGAAGSQLDDPNARLTAEAILRGWKLDADLVTLSACETGRGKLSGGEGYLGFSQALFLAGARSLVLSLWQVDDAATALLMTRFYENLLGTPEGAVKPMPKAEALVEAKRWLRSLKPEEVKELTKDLPTRGTRGRIEKRRGPGDANAIHSFEDPYFWSGFVLIGEAG